MCLFCPKNDAGMYLHDNFTEMVEGLLKTSLRLSHQLYAETKA